MLVAVVITNTNDGNTTILRMIKMTLPVFESFRSKLPACLCEKVALVQEARHHLVIVVSSTKLVTMTMNCTETRK